MAELLGWQEGCLLELDTKVDDPVRILLNGREIATGRMTVSERHYAVQVAEDVASEHIEGTDDG
jgi:flagellar motor switch/type III secretory pathway protein FliN